MKSLKLSRKRNLILMLGAFCLFGTQMTPAADSTQTPEAQLRERLRATMLQLRTAETERATLQAAQTQWTDEKGKLTERNLALTKQVNENKLTAQVVEGLKAQIANLEKENSQFKETIETTRQAAELARTKEAEHAKLVEEVVNGMERLIVDRQTKNLALYKTASEILQRYEKFGLGDALMAREPLIGITRVKLQNLVQDYQDKLQSDRVTLSEKDLASYREKLRLEPSAKLPSK